MERVKRKINVEKLSDEQLELANQRINTEVGNKINELTNKWVPMMDKFGIKVKLHFVVKPEDELEVTTKKHNKLTNDNADKLVLNELNKLGSEMANDINLATQSCNKLLNRYGLACDMEFVAID